MGRKDQATVLGARLARNSIETTGIKTCGICIVLSAHMHIHNRICVPVIIIVSRNTKQAVHRWRKMEERGKLKEAICVIAAPLKWKNRRKE